MLYNTGLEELIFNQHESLDVDELIIISGYLGPAPVELLGTLPLNTKVIYGMYASDGIGNRLHTALIRMQNSLDNINIMYSTFPVHSKCYIWKKDGQVVHALVGSANFSANGLRTPYREILTTANNSTFDALNTYANMVLNSAILCSEIDVVTRPRPDRGNQEERTTDYCRMTLVIPSTGEVHEASGLNWGQNPLNHTNPRDASIPIRTTHIRNYPELFPAKLEFPTDTIGGRQHRHNDAIEILWDDGTTMEGLLEGSQPVDGIRHPKQISSFPSKSILGDYLRARIGVASGAYVNTEDLINYGRTHIDISLIGEGVYYCDFSVPPANDQ